MSTIPLPERPDLEQLKKRARELQRERGIALNEAQLTLARGYGFASWPKLKRHIELVTRLTRSPDLAEASSDPVNEFLRTACLAYGDGDRTDVVPRPVDAIATANVWSAAATGSHRALEDRRAEAAHAGGPFDWEPLMYLCYGRVEMSESDAVAAARVLLDAGADPNAGYLWHGFPTPFTALTGVFGHGEGAQPPHPHSLVLARVLLEHGADPNDGQTLYNRQFAAGVEHLELLFEFGLGKGDGGPWKAKLTTALDAPTEMLSQQLRWAIHHDLRDRVRLLADNGVELQLPFDDERFGHCHGRTPARWAALCGNRDIVEELAMHDAHVYGGSVADTLIGAVMSGWREGALPHARVRRAANAARPSLVVQAAATGRRNAVRLAAELGWELNALGRADSPCEQPWQTALHTAVERDDAEMVELLLQLGADPSKKDARFTATPKEWAEHFGNDRIAGLLP